MTEGERNQHEQVSRAETGLGGPVGPKVQRTELSSTLIIDYWLHLPAQPKELVLLLHGFQQSGKHIFDKFIGLCPTDAAVLAPNGIFPLPQRQADGSYRVGFSWYFYDSHQDEYFIGMKPACGALEALVNKLGFSPLPKRLIGFSQGGYLAPVAAQWLNGVRQIVGVAAQYLPEEIEAEARARQQPWPVAFRVDGVHGQLDEIVTLESARRGHAQMLCSGARGEWIEIPEVGHRSSPPIQEAVRRLLAELSGV